MDGVGDARNCGTECDPFGGDRTARTLGEMGGRLPTKHVCLVSQLWIGRRSGDIGVQALPDDEIIARVVAKGVPADAAGFMVPMVSWLASNLSTTPTDTVERASGSKPAPVDAILSAQAVA